MHRSALSILAILIFTASLSRADELEILRSRTLTARPGAVRAVTTPGDLLPLRLFDDAQFNARLRSIENSPFNGFVWRGDLDEMPGSWVVLVESGGCLVGTVATGESYYRILCLGDSKHVIEEVRPLRQWIDDAVVVLAIDSEPFAAQGEVVSEALEPDEMVEMDVLVVYTKKAAKDFFRRYDTGYSNKNKAIKAFIQLAVAIGNTALENSEVHLRWRLVSAKRVRYKGKVDSSIDLANLRYRNDGELETVHALRDRYGADFVSLVVKEFEPGIAGRAYLSPPGPGARDRMFSVIEYDNLWDTVLAHEFGHNMGLAHDKDNDTSSEAWRSYRYSRGYRDPAAGFRTLMAYRDGCDSCAWKIPHFSNKEVKWQGADSGNPFYAPTCGDGTSTGPKCGRRTGKGKANCALSLNNTREFFAAVTPCKVDCGN